MVMKVFVIRNIIVSSEYDYGLRRTKVAPSFSTKATTECTRDLGDIRTSTPYTPVDDGAMSYCHTALLLPAAVHVIGVLLFATGHARR